MILCFSAEGKDVKAGKDVTPVTRQMMKTGAERRANATSR